MKTVYDLVIIGAGPAGIAAAVGAEKCSLSVIVLDEQIAPGGQVYRAVERTSPAKSAVLGTDYGEGSALVRQFRGSAVDYAAGASVWQIEPDLTVDFIRDSKARQVRGRRILLAPGARERPVPIPGWTLPGVMAVTAADILLKAHGIVPSGRVVLAGSGPLLYSTAVRLLAAGASVAAVLETTPLPNVVLSTPAIPAALKGYQYLLKGMAMKRRIASSGTPIYRSVTCIEALGDPFLKSVRFVLRGKTKELQVDTLFLHNGVVPDIHMTRQLGCEHRWNKLQRCWQPRVDGWGNTTVSAVGVAGDGAGISGARAAVAKGRLAALEAAFRLNVISRQERDTRAAPFRKAWNRERSVRPFLDRLFRPRKELLLPRSGATVVCRCEEVTAGQIREAVRLGAIGPNQLKAQTRAGMGPCQGRMCELTAAEIIADCRRVDVSEVGLMRIRPPIKPVTLTQLSEMTLAE